MRVDKSKHNNRDEVEFFITCDTKQVQHRKWVDNSKKKIGRKNENNFRKTVENTATRIK